MQDRIYPLTFEPVFRDYIWGGRRLETLYERALPPGVVAESWEISGHPNAPTSVTDEHWRGKTLPQVMAELGTELVGRRSRKALDRGLFPLLIKLLDANRDLSVQVHPDDELASQIEGARLGKTEMWYVLHAEPGAELIYGLACGVTKSSFKQALAEGEVETQLHRLPIAAGDAIFVPAGTVHALLAGAIVVEVQQNSDTTYRVYDWGRTGANGEPRELHIDKALRAIDWARIAPQKAASVPLAAEEGMGRSLLVSCPQFAVERFEMGAQAQHRGCCDGSTFEIWGCLQGAVSLRWQGGSMRLDAVGFSLLPAALGGYALSAEKPTTLLRIYIPDQALGRPIRASLASTSQRGARAPSEASPV
ncbi:MAG: class I mannose-6-phosphate isomerase [Chloroflexi bacterium]|nr:class I mannose-6-phosphate isomerase [Chloroflexota bacterium]